MNAEGKVVAQLEGQRTIEGFKGLLKAGQDFIDTKAKADGGDAPAKVDYFLRALKLHHFNLADGQKYRDSLKDLVADQRAKIDALLVVVEMGEVVDSLRKGKEKDPAKVKEMKAEAGRKFWAMHKAGRIPAEDNSFGNFYSTILDYAEHDKDIPTFELALKTLQERFPKAPKKFFDAKLEILEKLKAEKAAPPKDEKKDGK